MPRWRRRRFARQRRKLRDAAYHFIAGIDYAKDGAVEYMALTIAALKPATRGVVIHSQVLLRKPIPHITLGARVVVNGGN